MPRLPGGAGLDWGARLLDGAGQELGRAGLGWAGFAGVRG